jgi:hypothetical protein
MLVRNINGSSQNICACGSWLEHWKKFSGLNAPMFCPVIGCYAYAIVGAHVQKENVNDDNWYIVPLCKEHNSQTGHSLEIIDIKLVSANVAETCG